MPKIVDDTERKEIIIQTATELFVRDGYQKTKFATIAEQCGLGRTTIYQYFKNKDEVFMAVLDKVYKELQSDYINIVFEKDASSIDKIRSVIYKAFRDYYRKKKMMIVVVNYLLQMQRRKTALKAKINEQTLTLQILLQQLLKEGIETGELKEHDTQNMAWVLFSLIRAFIIQVSITEDFSLRELKDSIDLLLDGLKK